MIDGRGSRDPIADNSTPAGRAQNRRVEIYVGQAASPEQQQRAGQYGNGQNGQYQGQGQNGQYNNGQYNRQGGQSTNELRLSTTRRITDPPSPPLPPSGPPRDYEIGRASCRERV